MSWALLYIADLSLLPRSRRKHMESGPTAPQVSTVIGWNWHGMLGPDGRTSWLSQSLDALPPASLAVA